MTFCLIVFVGYYLYRHTNSSKTSSISQTAASNNPSSLTTRAKYIVNYDVNNHGTNVAEALYYQGYITQSLLAYLQQNQFKNADNIICAQAPADSWSYGKPVISNNNTTASLSITGNYSGSGPNVVTTDWINTSGTWQENAIVCPVPN